MKGRPRKGQVPETEYELVKEMYVNNNMSLNELAKRFFVSTYVIKEILLERCVTLKGRGRRKTL